MSLILLACRLERTSSVSCRRHILTCCLPSAFLQCLFRVSDQPPLYCVLPLTPDNRPHATPSFLPFFFSSPPSLPAPAPISPRKFWCICPEHPRVRMRIAQPDPFDPLLCVGLIGTSLTREPARARRSLPFPSPVYLVKFGTSILNFNY